MLRILRYKNRKMEADRNRLVAIVFAIFFVGLVLCIPLSRYAETLLFLDAYLLIGLACIVIAPQWLTAFTSFFFLYALDSVFGTALFLVNKSDLNFNPWFIIHGGLACLVLGYAVHGAFPKICKKKALRITCAKRISSKQALMLTYVISVASSILYLVKNISIFGANLNAERITAQGGNGLLVLLMNLQIITMPSLYLEYKKGRCKHFVLLAVFASLPLLATGFRSPFISVVVIILVINIFEGNIRVKKIIPILIVLLFGVMTWGTIRSGQERASFFDQVRNFLTPGAWNLNQLFKAFDKKDFLHGYTYLINIEMLRPGSDLDFTLWLKELLGLNFSGGGMTPTLIGEFYINFGYIGIYLGMFITGFIFFSIDRWILSGKISVWKAYVLFLTASTASGGIGNVYLYPTLMAIYFAILRLFTNDAEGLEYAQLNRQSQSK